MENTTNAAPVPQTTTCHCHSGIWIGLIFITVWVMGVVIAKGFWSTFLAIFIPPWAWYLTVERTMLLLLGPAWL